MLWSLCLKRFSGFLIGFNARQRWRLSGAGIFPLAFAAEDHVSCSRVIFAIGPKPSTVLTSAPPGRPCRTSADSASHSSGSGTSTEAHNDGANAHDARNTISNHAPVPILIVFSLT